MKPIRRNVRLALQTERKIRAVARRVLRGQRIALTVYVKRRPTSKAHDLPSEADLREWLGALDGKSWDEDVQAELRDLLSQLAAERSSAAMDHVADYLRGDDAEYRRLLDQANDRAVQWAQDRVGNLITQVSDTTRQAVNELAADAIAEGLTNDELAGRIGDAFAFSDDRADMIARTETANAETQGSLAGYRESGVVEAKEWSADELACDECDGLDGEQVGLDEPFSDGSDGPPAHPDCRCTVVPVIADDQTD